MKKLYFVHGNRPSRHKFTPRLRSRASIPAAATPTSDRRASGGSMRSAPQGGHAELVEALEGDEWFKERGAGTPKGKVTMLRDAAAAAVDDDAASTASGEAVEDAASQAQQNIAEHLHDLQHTVLRDHTQELHELRDSWLEMQPTVQQEIMSRRQKPVQY